MGVIDIAKTVTIDVTPDRAWEILADEFTDVSRWSSSIASSKPNSAATSIPDGAEHGGRICDVPGFGLIDERFTHYDAANKTFTYSASADKIPGFVKDMRNTWTVEPNSRGKANVTTRVNASATGLLGTMMGPMMRMKFAKTINQILDDLTVYAESGNVSAAKTKQLSKAARN